jgi:hypothetical protein
MVHCNQINKVLFMVENQKDKILREERAAEELAIEQRKAIESGAAFIPCTENSPYLVMQPDFWHTNEPSMTVTGPPRNGHQEQI